MPSDSAPADPSPYARPIAANETSCRRCGRRWKSLKQAHCVRCCEHFSSASSFDAHQTGNDPVVCHPPADRGLAARTDRYGSVWRAPATRGFLERLDTLRAAEAAAELDADGSAG